MPRLLSTLSIIALLSTPLAAIAQQTGKQEGCGMYGDADDHAAEGTLNHTFIGTFSTFHDILP